MLRGGDKIPHPNPPLAKGRGQDSGFPPLQGGIKGGKFPPLRGDKTPVSPLLQALQGGIKGGKIPCFTGDSGFPPLQGGIKGGKSLLVKTLFN